MAGLSVTVDKLSDTRLLTRDIIDSIVLRLVRHTEQLYTLVPDRYVRCLKPIALVPRASCPTIGEAALGCERPVFWMQGESS